MSRRTLLLAVAVCCAYPLLNHLAVVLHEPRWAAVGIALVAWGVTTGWLSALAAALLAAAVLVFSLWMAGRFPGLLLFVPPVVINLALCLLFARTLGPGREALISVFVRAERGGQLPQDLARYTRSLTGLWAVFFLAMAAVSIGLALTATLDAWSLFTNIANYLLVGVFFIVEYLYRRLRYRHHSHATPRQMVRLMRNFKVVPRPPGQAVE